MPVPIYILHYKGNSDRRGYLEEMLTNADLRVHWISECDAGEFDLGAHYVFDESSHRMMIDPIKEIMVGNYLGLQLWPDVPWAECIDRVREKNRNLEEMAQMEPWLRPTPLNLANVSLILKHRLAWERIAAGTDEWAVVAEDDIIFLDDSMPYLLDFVRVLPADFDYIDLAGGCRMFPRAGNRLVNRFFFEIDPPGGRTTCAVLIHQSFARRMTALRPPICLPIDWTLTWSFNRLNAKVFWLDPPLFGHGSELNFYESNLR